MTRKNNCQFLIIGFAEDEEKSDRRIFKTG